jgi:hypothetical protein
VSLCERKTPDFKLIIVFLSSPAENERLPTELGWDVRDNVVDVKAILRISNMIGKATSLFTGSADESGATGTAEKLRRGFYAGARREL